MKWGSLHDEMAQFMSSLRWYETQDGLFLCLHLFETKK